MTSLDIVIVNWNAGEQLKDCLDSIENVECNSFKIGEVIVVDNNSTDNSITLIEEKKYKYNIKIINNLSNAGFAKACNQGGYYGKSEYILFLNPDTILFQESLNSVMSYCQNATYELGVTGIKLIDNNESVTRTCRMFPKKRNRIAKVLGLTIIFPGLSSQMLTWDHNELREVDQIMGAFFIVKRTLFDELNGFDERFFVYYEEVDFCKRAQEKGYKNYFYPHSKAFHEGGGTTNQVKDMRLFYSLRSWLQYEKKHNGTSSAFFALFIELLEYFSRVLYLLFKNRLKEIKELNSAYKLLFKNLNKILI